MHFTISNLSYVINCRDSLLVKVEVAMYTQVAWIKVKTLCIIPNYCTSRRIHSSLVTQVHVNNILHLLDDINGNIGGIYWLAMKTKDVLMYMIHSGNIDFLVTQDCCTNIANSLMSPANASNLGAHFENDLHVYRRFWLELFRSSLGRPHQQLLSIDCETHVTHWELQWKDRASLGYPWSDTYERSIPSSILIH